MKSNLLESDCLEDRAAWAGYFYTEDGKIVTGNVEWTAFTHEWSFKTQQYWTLDSHNTVLLYTSHSCKHTKNAEN
jgi:hypothetical protein